MTTALFTKEYYQKLTGVSLDNINTFKTECRSVIRGVFEPNMKLAVNYQCVCLI